MREHSKPLHDCPSCVCGLDCFIWSDREIYIDTNDADNIIECILNCVQDHIYDRTKTGIPYSSYFTSQQADKLAKVVSSFMAANEPSWFDKTTSLTDSQKEELSGLLKEVLTNEK